MKFHETAPPRNEELVAPLLQDTCDFSDQDWIWIFVFEKFCIRTGSGYLFDFNNEISLRVTNDRGSVFFAMILIFT